MPAGSQHHQHFCDEQMAHDVGLGQPHHGNIRDRVEPAGDLGEPVEEVEEVAPVAGGRSGRGRRSYPPCGGLRTASSMSTSRSRWVKVVGSRCSS
jgi:hypothetical protein